MTTLNLPATVAAFKQQEQIDGFAPSDDEGYFSRSPCECCEQPLGGTRHDVQGYSAGVGPACSYAVCTDCMVYEINGDLPTY